MNDCHTTNWYGPRAGNPKRRMIRPAVLCIAVIWSFIGVAQGGDGCHLFILSGQSNMAHLDPDVSFRPLVEKTFGKNRVIIIKAAKNGQPIRRWYKQWKPVPDTKPPEDKEPYGNIYDQMMKQIKTSTQGKRVETVTFCWMQGEKDAKQKQGAVYEASLNGLLQQLSVDLGRNDVNFVIGRLSDCKSGGHWQKVREAQVAVAKASPRGAWVDTDSFNDGKNSRGTVLTNNLHYSVEGYRNFGKRLAEEAIKLIKANTDK